MNMAGYVVPVRIVAEVNGQRENGMTNGTNLARVSESMPVEDGESYVPPDVGHGFPHLPDVQSTKTNIL